MYRTSSQEQLRLDNLSAILYCLRAVSPLSRAQLANLTRLNKSTVSSLTDELLSLKLVWETGSAASSGGRPATMLELNPSAGCMIGLEFGVDFILAILTDFVGQIILRRRIEIDPDLSQEIVINRALALVDELIASDEARGERLFGMGLALPGMVDVESGLLLFSPNLQWRNAALRQIFQEHTGLLVYVENDANAAALGEHFLGRARQAEDFIFILAGVGVGGGFFLGGNLYRGVGGLAGEIGHTNFVGGGDRPCRCGKRGCWEAYSNQSALLERVRVALEVGRPSLITSFSGGAQQPLTVSVIGQAARAQDEVALEALADTGRSLGIGLANLINIFNPEMIIFGGPLSEVGDFLLPIMVETIDREALAEPHSQTTVSLSQFGTDAIVVGAVTLVFQAVLSNPRSGWGGEAPVVSS